MVYEISKNIDTFNRLTIPIYCTIVTPVQKRFFQQGPLATEICIYVSNLTFEISNFTAST